MVIHTCGSSFLGPNLWTEGRKLASALGAECLESNQMWSQRVVAFFGCVGVTEVLIHYARVEENEIGIDQLLILAPSLRQSRTCVSGRRCRLHVIHGIYLSPEDHFFDCSIIVVAVQRFCLSEQRTWQQLVEVIVYVGVRGLLVMMITHAGGRAK